jgi:hypothetical protein
LPVFEGECPELRPELFAEGVVNVTVWSDELSPVL